MKTIYIGMIVVLLLPACAKDRLYYAAVENQTAAIIESIERQGARIASSRVDRFGAYSQASTMAANTPGTNDDVLVAFAWGYAAATPYNIEIPRLAAIKAPSDGVDYLRAALPYASLLYPFLYGFGSRNNTGRETTYTATSGGKISVGSQNAGSFNRAGGDMATTVTSQDNSTCENCGEDGVDGQLNPLNTPTNCDGYPDAVFLDGIWWIDSGASCSCQSRSEGRC